MKRGRRKEDECPDCRGKLHWETMAGVIRVYREVNGRKVYRARCSECKQTHDIDGGRA